MQFLSAFGSLTNSNLAVTKPIFSLKTIAPRTFIAGCAHLLVWTNMYSFHMDQPSLKMRNTKKLSSAPFFRRDEKTLKV
jgi:hypothetical protein